jgi:Zn-dependent M28 family amino/carboxypeptidase
LRKFSHFVLAALFVFSTLVGGCRSENDRIADNGLIHNSNDHTRQEHLRDDLSPVLEFAESITMDELKEHVAYLASDSLEGRFSGTDGADMAAVYIANNFEELDLLGLPDEDQPYFQRFQMQKKQMKENYFENDEAKVENWIHYGERFSHYAGEKDVELVFAGFGRAVDLEGIDIKDKLVAFFPGGPDSSEMNMDREKVKMDAIFARGGAGFLLIFTDESSRPAYARFRKAYFNDVRYYLYKTENEALDARRSIVIFASDLAGMFGINTARFLSTLDEMRSGKNAAGMYSTSVRMNTMYDTFGTIDGKNVLAYMEGMDKKDEWIILTAHYDHLGMHRGHVYNGADDNASGVAALLEIAEAFALAAQEGQRPRRSILFLSPDAEEIGANGSLYYVENPLAPLSRIVVDINLDSIGRGDAQKPALKDFVYVYTSRNGRDELDAARSKAEGKYADKPRIEIKPTAPGSDNYIFEMEGVPVIAYTTGHSRDYHQPSDTLNKLDYKNLHRIVRLIFVTTWEIANQDNSIHRTNFDH